MIHEGTVFQIPLDGAIRAIGAVARIRGRRSGSRILLVYCWLFPRDDHTDYLDADQLSRAAPVLVGQVGDLYLHQGLWPILGAARGFDRINFPVPPMIRTDPITGEATFVKYNDHLEEIGTWSAAAARNAKHRDVLYGPGALRIRLQSMAENR